MLFCGISKSERIDLHPEENSNELWYIELTIDKHEPVFYVHAFDDNEVEWLWEFWYLSNTVYEKVKMCIIDIACEVKDMNMLLYTLNDVFHEYFEDLFVEEVECDSLLN